MEGPVPSNGLHFEGKAVRMNGSHSSVFENVKLCPPDAIFHVKESYLADKSPNKVNLGVGAYRTEKGEPWVLPVVRTIEAQMSVDPVLNHEYLQIDGLKAFTEAASRLLLSDSSLAITQNRVCGVQSLSGTGAIRLGLSFLFQNYPSKTLYLSRPTWGNHKGIASAVGYTDVREYRYYKQETRGLDFEGMIQDIKDAPEGSIFILHTCAHNPTGVDPNTSQWRDILYAIKEKKMFVLFDTAYQGFASGDLDKDAFAVREAVKLGLEFFAAQSFSKNFGLYNERCGQLCCVVKSPEIATVLRSQLAILCRRMWSNPPNHGARIVATALNNPSLRQEWLENLTTMTSRIHSMRKELHSLLKANGTPGNWDHIVNQIGMFTFTGLSSVQVEQLTARHHIYLLKNGRINMCGLNSSNLEYVADAIKDVVSSFPESG